MEFTVSFGSTFTKPREVDGSELVAIRDAIIGMLRPHQEMLENKDLLISTIQRGPNTRGLEKAVINHQTEKGSRSFQVLVPINEYLYFVKVEAPNAVLATELCKDAVGNGLPASPQSGSGNGKLGGNGSTGGLRDLKGFFTNKKTAADNLSRTFALIWKLAQKRWVNNTVLGRALNKEFRCQFSLRGWGMALKILVDQGLLDRKDGRYRLTDKGLALVPEAAGASPQSGSGSDPDGLENLRGFFQGGKDSASNLNRVLVVIGKLTTERPVHYTELIPELNKEFGCDFSTKAWGAAFRVPLREELISNERGCYGLTDKGRALLLQSPADTGISSHTSAPASSSPKPTADFESLQQILSTVPQLAALLEVLRVSLQSNDILTELRKAERAATEMVHFRQGQLELAKQDLAEIRQRKEALEAVLVSPAEAISPS